MQLLMDRGYGRGRRRDQLGTDGGRQARAAVADQVELPRPQEPRQPAQGRRVHLRAVALRVHEHVQRGGGARRLYERYHIPASGRVFWAVRSRTSIRGPTTRMWTTRTPTGRRCSSSLAARITSCPRRSSARTRIPTRRRARSPRSSSTTAARTSCPPRTGGREIADYALTWATEQAFAWATSR